jgi:hypothetical protein
MGATEPWQHRDEGEKKSPREPEYGLELAGRKGGRGQKSCNSLAVGTATKGYKEFSGYGIAII